MLTVLHLTLVLWMAIPFPYFMTAGANIFTVPKLRDNGAMLGQISFISGMACGLVMGLFYGLLVPAAVCGAILALGAVMLYEWTRRTVVDRTFYVGLAGEVPPAVCDAGPYRYVRHPFYLSYMVAFVAVAVAFPSVIVSGVCALNIGLFVYMALDDERMLQQSPLATDYESFDVLPRPKKGGDSFRKTATSRREDDLCSVDVPVMDRSACAASAHLLFQDLRYL
jgi:protein-S-isoprenylcysteine O-methyltransferase Ste14